MQLDIDVNLSFEVVKNPPPPPPTEKLDLQMQTAKDNLWEEMNVGAVEETQKQQEAFQAQGFSL